MDKAGWRPVASVMVCCALLLGPAPCQTTITSAVPAAPPPVANAGVLVDQVIAVVNGDVILESDVEEERRFGAFQPLQVSAREFARAGAIERLVDRALIMQQEKLQSDIVTPDAEVDAQLQQLRRDIPACKSEYHCETDAGWERFVHDQGFTLPELHERWQERMQILKFIDIRFKAGIRITPPEIKTYYDTKLVPEYAKRKSSAPPLSAISDRIGEILLQERVTGLLDDWLQSLKAQGAVRMLKPDEAP